MPLEKTLSRTLESWSARIYGFDLYDDFVRSAKSRIQLSAISRHLELSKSKSENFEYLGNINISDFLANKELIKQVDCIVINPPFGKIDLTGKVNWTQGTGQQAGLFIDYILSECRPGQRIVAILPDVLRSGSRYQKWRKLVLSKVKDIEIIEFGRFNTEADVDVFVMDVTVGEASVEKQNGWNVFSPKKTAQRTVSDFFNISVGPVVPHRQKITKESAPYVDSRSARVGEVHAPEKECSYSCTLKKPPFVAIRRTSSPKDSPRIKASVIIGKDLVAVENHLIVAEPYNGTLTECKSLLSMLMKESTGALVNRMIRCRHLTVNSIKDLPYSGKK